MMVQGVDILFAVEPSVQNQLDLVQLEKINVSKERTNRRDIGNVTGQCTIINR